MPSIIGAHFQKKLFLSQKQRNWRTPWPFFSTRIVVFRPRLESSYFSVDLPHFFTWLRFFVFFVFQIFHLLKLICSEHNLSLGYTFNTFLNWVISAPILLPSKVYSYTYKKKSVIRLLNLSSWQLKSVWEKNLLRYRRQLTNSIHTIWFQIRRENMEYTSRSWDPSHHCFNPSSQR